MTDVAVEPSSPVFTSRREWPRWTFSALVPIAIFAIVRMFDALVIEYASRFQVPVGSGTHPGMFGFVNKSADPGYWSVITNWDGQWYQFISTDGYHTHAVATVGAVNTSWAWAFPPLFPLLTHGLMDLTGWSFAVAASILNLCLGALAMVLLYCLVDKAAGRFLAVSAVALSSCFISAPLLQAAYSEALGFVLLLSTLLMIRRRSYAWTLLPLTALAFTRLITVPIAVVALTVLVTRWRARERDPLNRREGVGLALIAAVSIVGVWLWSALAALLAPAPTGASARTSISAGTTIGWFSDMYQYLGWPGLLFVACLATLFILIACSRWTDGWGVEVRTWLAAYPVFLLVATPVTGGIFRYLLLCPLLRCSLQEVRDSSGEKSDWSTSCWLV
ncbi:hypothetical protein [Flexivirga alba]|uniref:Glycosyltransferase RgtA/B/C/D-like domain-containing protein n=1 Tax=Flexivirga alba TaxID=702742 RepID=A0ABW2AC08_9MICO